MSKIYLALEGEKVTLIHYMPFDEVNGFHKTEFELQQMGALVDSVPDATPMNGKNAVPMYNKTDGFYYAYEDIVLTDSDAKLDAQEKQIEEIENVLAEIIYGGAL